MTTMALILLAAGFSRRFGPNKLIYPFQGQPLYRWGMRRLQMAARACEKQQQHVSLTVVTTYAAISQAAGKLGYQSVYNENAAEGQAASLRAGLKANARADYWAFFPADQPYLSAKTIIAFLQGFLAAKARLGCMYNGRQRCSPAIFSRFWQKELLALRGDTGGRSLIRRPETWVYTPPDERELQDIDYPGDIVL